MSERTESEKFTSRSQQRISKSMVLRLNPMNSTTGEGSSSTSGCASAIASRIASTCRGIGS